MKKYIVGGYVRDRILGLTPKDKDYVLVGANKKDIEYLNSIGYKQVGKDFPVFLSPQGDEYALARTERKTGNGYDGFTVNTEGVTLEQDLSRRDFTMNSIAWDTVLKVHIDPFNGKEDIKNKIIKHTSPAFKEDPLRVLRLARFLCRYSDFTVHKDTDIMVRKMVSDGEIDHLTPERVYVEFEKAFNEEKPSIFLKYLKDIGAMKKLIPSFDCTQKELELIDLISSESSSHYKHDFIWTIILNNCTANNNYVVGGIKLPARMVKFSNYIKTHNQKLLKFRKNTPTEMVELLTSMNIKNNGGEEFLYKVLEYFTIRREIDTEFELIIMKVFDCFTDAPIGDIESMVHEGKLKSSDIRTYIKDIQIAEVEKMFS